MRISKSYLFFILLLFSGVLYSQGSVEIKRDSLLEVCYHQSLDDTLKGEAFTELSSYYFQISLDSVQLVCQDGLVFISAARKNASKKERNSLLGSEGILFMNAGSASYLKGDLDEAIVYWYKSLEKKEELKDDIGRANVLNNIANVQIDLGDLEKAEQSFDEILEIQIEIPDSIGLARTYNSLGYIYRVKGDDTTALVYYKKSLELRQLMNDQIGIAGCHNNIGFVFKKRRDYLAAIEEYDQALAIYTQVNANEGKVVVLNNIANCYLELGQLSKANLIAKKGYAIALQLDLKIDLKFLNEVLYKINKEAGSYKDALLHLENFIEIRDSIDSEKNYKALINQEAKYEVQQIEEARLQEKKIEELKHISEIELADEKASWLTFIILAIGVALSVVLFLVYLLYKQLKIAKTQRLIIESQNKEIEMKALRSQMNPHFLFNSLNSIKHFIIKNESEVAANYLTKFAKVIRLVLENSQHNLIRLDEELECLKYYLELEKLRFNNKFDYKIEGDVNADFIQLPPLILQPFIENAIWHGLLKKEGDNGLISIKLSEVNNAVVIAIEDNGIGRVKAATYKATDGAKKESMGLNITHDRLKALNNVIGIKSSVEIIDLYKDNEATGTRVVLTIPYNE